MSLVPLLMTTSGMAPQTKTSTEMTQVIKTSLKKLVTERQSEVRGHSWAGTRSLNLTVSSSDDNPFCRFLSPANCQTACR